MPVYRCFNANCPSAGTDFDAPAPVCPGCKMDGRKNTSVIAEVAQIHYLVADPAGLIATPLGNRRVACAPSRAWLPKYASGERSVVTCARCKATAVFTGHEKDGVDQHVPHAERKIQAEHGLQSLPQN